jgi:ribonuclease D
MPVVLIADDLPPGLTFPTGMVAIDTETTGLELNTSSLCLIQVGDGQGNAWLVKPTPHAPDAPPLTMPNLRALLENPRLTKLFHYARFDLAMLQKHLGLADVGPLYCTKIASKLARHTSTKHNLRTLCAELLGVELDKTEQMSDWAAPTLTESQQAYAASDVLHLHALAEKLTALLAEQHLTHAMDQSLRFLPTRVALDLAGHPEGDVFGHH